MKKIFFILALASLIVMATTAWAVYDEPSNQASTVTSISLTGQGADIAWQTNGYSSQGFKVVWSKTENPTYPLRSTDQYLYYSEPQQSSAMLKAFAGEGTYYVRVCEYLGGKCGVYSNQISVTLSSGTPEGQVTAKCASEGQMTSGPVSPEYQYHCCQGYESLDPYQDGRLGAGRLCYHPKKGLPKCYQGPNGEGWYYPDGSKLILKSCPKSQGEMIACTLDYNPVCGQDGKTYGNTCMLSAAKVEPAYKGECRPEQSEIPKNCVLWYDGCNNCMVKNDLLACTKRACVRQDTPKCLQYQNDELKPEPMPKAVRTGLFRFAKWECYDGAREENIKDKDCKRVEEWREQADKFCQQACSADTGKCGVNSFAVWRDCSPEIVAIEDKAGKLNDQRLEELLKELAMLRNKVKEQEDELKYLRSLAGKMNNLSDDKQEAIKSFVSYGVDDNTKRLGEGERAAVVHSYEAAYGKLPTEEEELVDLIKIANGRFPGEINEAAEQRASERFRLIYHREAEADNTNDQAAIKIMAYGLKQRAENRNLNSEAQGIKTFIAIFKFHPNQAEANGWTKAEAWNSVQAITYSGAKR